MPTRSGQYRRTGRAAAASCAAGCLMALTAGACSSGSSPTKDTAPPPATTPSTTTPPASTAPVASTTTGTVAATTVAPTTSTTAAPTTTTTRDTPPATARRTVEASACPVELPDRLASTGGGHQLITVESDGSSTSEAVVETWSLNDGCWRRAGGPWDGMIGANGFSSHHREGDDTTPTGIYGIGSVMYGNAANPGVHETYVKLKCGDWWDEDPTSPAYNTFQPLACGQKPSFGGGSEPLWEETAAYPSFAVIDYNTDPIVAYAGSAIFLHADTGSPTAGCVSIPLADLDRVLRWIEPGDDPHIAMAPSSVIGRY